MHLHNLRCYFDFGPIANKMCQITHLNNLFTVIGGKFKFSSHEIYMEHFVRNGTKLKTTSEVKPLFDYTATS